MKPTVFLDSGIFIALLNRRDRWHDAAVALFGGKPPRWCTSWLVVSETYSWFLHRMGEDAARSFRQCIDALPKLTIFDADAALHRRTLRMLEQFRGSKLTYVDASSLSLLATHKISTVWSTDHHLGIAGTALLPRT